MVRACRLVTWQTNQDAAERFGRFGHHFGLAFQIADDVLDIQHNTSGKTPFADLRNKNPSFPIVLACKQSTSFKQELEQAWIPEVPSEETIIQLRKLFSRNGHRYSMH